ncbi:MAG: hypothetical protein QHI38_05105 [Armatimonadota bacterium]|nr:hypothetical protein [Armatimonadota bacterium]
MAPHKIEFSTVRELERKTHKVFMYSGSSLLIGLLLTLIGLVVIGVPVIILSLVVLIGAMAYVSVLGKEPTRTLFCPYCASKNEVYRSRTRFSCDICRRPVVIDENGEPAPAEPIDTTARYNR